MLEQSVVINLTSPDLAEHVTSQLRQEYQARQSLFQAQPKLVQLYLDTQAASLGKAIVEGLSFIRFSLPDQVVIPDQDMEGKTIPVPAKNRIQAIGGLISRLARRNLQKELNLCLLDLEHYINQAVSISSLLLRHALVIHLVHDMLPSGRMVLYSALKWDDIPSIPIHRKVKPDSGGVAATTSNDTVDIKTEAVLEDQIPDAEVAQDFYLPQWVAFDNDGHLLVESVEEAEAYVASMVRYLSILRTAAELAPYIVADEDYQRKRYGITGQLVNQGRALADYEVNEIIQKIKNRTTFHDLDQGLRLSIPYFNDQTLKLETCSFDVIPTGRVMFVSAFVVLAVRAQGAKVVEDTRFNKSTRRHLLFELYKLEEAFLR